MVKEKLAQKEGSQCKGFLYGGRTKRYAKKVSSLSGSSQDCLPKLVNSKNPSPFSSSNQISNITSPHLLSAARFSVYLSIRNVRKTKSMNDTYNMNANENASISSCLIQLLVLIMGLYKGGGC